MKINIINRYFATVTAAVVAVILPGGCSKMIDDIRPYNAISSDKVTEADLGKLTNGVLYQMENVVSDAWTDGDFIAENFTGGAGFTYGDVHSDTESPSASTVKSRWQTYFTNLMAVNELLKSAESSSSTDVSVLTAKGTAHFFRAYIYYCLVTRFGGVPILEKPSMSVVPISPQADVWNLILRDLQAAESELTDFSSFYYPSKQATWLLLAKVNLWLGNKDEAASYADKVISSGKFTLENTSSGYASMFISSTTSREIVLALANKRSSSYKKLYDRFNDNDGSWNYAIADELRTTLFEDTAVKTGDLRSAPTYNPAVPNRIIKFPNGVDEYQFIEDKNSANQPLMMFRLSDAYLIKAEAQGVSAGLATLKEWMASRYATVTLPATMSDSDFQNLILDENQREFFAEGHRWFDIKRTGRTDLYRSWNGRDYLLLWPIPQSERDLAGHNAYPQNSGYPD